MSEVGVIVRCPTCKRTSAWSADNPHRPFCSDRCRLIDLGAWLSESHRIPGEPVTDESMLEDSANHPDRPPAAT